MINWFQTLLFRDVSPSCAAGEEVCEERYPGKELQLCKDRLTGVAFDTFDQPPQKTNDDDDDDDGVDDDDDDDGGEAEADDDGNDGARRDEL